MLEILGTRIPKAKSELVNAIYWVHLTWASTLSLELWTSRLNSLGKRYTSADVEELNHEHYHRYLFGLQFCNIEEV